VLRWLIRRLNETGTAGGVRLWIRAQVRPGGGILGLVDVNVGCDHPKDPNGSDRSKAALSKG
jgi:cyanate lyase